MKRYILLLIACSTLMANAQVNHLNLPEAMAMALKNNLGIKAAASELESQKQLRRTSFDLPKTDISLLYGQYNSYTKNDNNITVTQAIPFAALGSQGSLNRSLLAASEFKKTSTENELIFQVKQTYYQLALALAKQTLLLQQDSIFEGFYRAASLRYKSGETNLLEQATAETQRNEVKNQLRNTEASILVLRTQLKTLLNSETLPEITANALTELQFNETPDTAALSANPSLAYLRQQVEVAKSQKKVEAAKFAPDLLVGFFSQTLIGAVDPENGALASSSDRFTGFQVGISVPIWFVPHQGRVKAAEYSKQAAQNNFEHYQTILQGQLQQAAQQYSKDKNSLAYYRTSAIPNADLILKQSQTAFRGGEIGYTEYLLGVRNAIAIKESYLETLHDYNQSIIYIEFLSGIK